MIGPRRLILLALILSLAAPAAAQTTVAVGVSEEATEANSEPKIARDGRGGIHLAFVKPSGGIDQVHVASSTDGGRTWRLRQLTTRPVPSRYPTLAAGPDGSLHLAWTQYEPIGHVYYARFDGARWTTPVKVSQGDAYAGVPAIGVDPQGEAHIVWYGIRNQAPQVRTRHGSLYEILYSGTVHGRWSVPVIISHGIPDSINPALAVDAQGRLHSAWYQFDLRAYQVEYTRRVGTWEFPQRVSAGGDDAFAVALAASPAGSVYVVWERRAQPAARIYFAERRDRWSGQEAVSPEAQSASTPTVAVDDRDRVYVVWASGGQLYLRRRDRQWLGTERLTSEGVNSHPVLAARGGSVDLMWTQEAGGDHRVRFVTLGGAAGSPGKPSAAGVVILAVIIALLVWQVQRRRRLVGTDPR